MVAVGIVVGAGAAAKLVTLETVARCMPAGILIGIGVLFFSLQHALLPAYVLLLLIGMLGGFFVVPLNALLQEREELEFEIPSTMVMAEAAMPRVMKVLARGDYRNGTDPVTPGVPGFLPPLPAVVSAC